MNAVMIFASYISYSCVNIYIPRRMLNYAKVEHKIVLSKIICWFAFTCRRLMCIRKRYYHNWKEKRNNNYATHRYSARSIRNPKCSHFLVELKVTHYENEYLPV